MRKYKVAKWLVLFTAIFAVACFFTPFIYCGVSISRSGTINYSFSGEGGPLYYGFDLMSGIFGRYITILNSTAAVISYDMSVFGQAMTIISLIISICAVVFALLSIILKNVNGLNKKNKIHKSLIVSMSLSVSSALINLISMLVISSVTSGDLLTISSVTSGDFGTNSITAKTICEPFTFIGLILLQYSYR